MGAQDQAQSLIVDPIDQLDPNQQQSVAKRIWSWYRSVLSKHVARARKQLEKDASNKLKKQHYQTLQRQLDTLKSNEGAFKSNLRSLLDWSKDPSLAEIHSPSTIDKMIADELKENQR